jgi:hypothetical protein
VPGIDANNVCYPQVTGSGGPELAVY